MNIGIDARIIERKITGIGRFLWMLLKELPEADKDNKYFLFTYDKLDVNNTYFTNIPTVNKNGFGKLFAPYWMNFILPRYLKKYNIDILFSINQLTPIVKVKQIKYILVLHDVIHLVNKSFHPWIYRKYLKYMMHCSINASDQIITVSEYSKKDIIKYYKNANPDKIRVLYQAAEKGFKPEQISQVERDKLFHTLGDPAHLVLYVGMIENRKNIKGILAIADEVIIKNKNIKFVLVGKIGYGGKNLIPEIKKRNNVVYLQNIDDDLLKKLLNVSTAFLFPSFYEGFGYPPLEAMQAGLPVLSSNNTSLIEVVGKGGLLFDPNDYISFAENIIKLTEDKQFYEEMRQKALTKAKEFDIAKTVTELINIFNSCKE
jgi:glycosyltransferase involved in cell wall biosynthesis